MPHSTEVQDANVAEIQVKEQLFVNDGLLPPSRIAILRHSSPDEPLEELHKRYDEDGYLFLKGLLPRADVLKTREDYFKFIAPSGILKENTAPVDGIFDITTDAAAYPGIGAGAVGDNGHPGEHAARFADLAIDAHKQAWYTEKLCKHPVLRDWVAGFTGWGDRTLGIQRTLLHNLVYGSKAVGVHYDQIFLRQGEPTSVTAWVPIGDISIEGGGLIYFEGAHHLGREIEAGFTKRARESGLTDEEAISAFNQNMLSTGLLADGPLDFCEQYDRRWLVSSYEAGDVVLHNPYAIHASTKNFDQKGVIRLATDLRFVDSSKPWDKRWEKYYEFGDGL